MLNAEQIRACDRFTIENEPIASIDLMERAANAIAKWLIGHYNNPRFVFLLVRATTVAMLWLSPDFYPTSLRKTLCIS